MDMKFCQSCGMPMAGHEELYGTDKDGSRNEEYCQYCYENGAFIADISMQEMIEFCIPHMVSGNADMTEEQARTMMQQFFPTLKRWSTR